MGIRANNLILVEEIKPIKILQDHLGIWKDQIKDDSALKKRTMKNWTKYDGVFNELKRLEFDIRVLTEIKKKRQGSEITGDYIYLYSGVHQN